MAKIRLAALFVFSLALAWRLFSATPPATPPAPPAVPAHAEAALSAISRVAKMAPARASSVAFRNEGNVAQSLWDSLRERVRSLESTDQPGLDRLYQDAAERVREDEPRALRTLEESYHSLLRSRLEEGFFVVSSWLRSSRAPAEVLRVIWTQAPQGDDSQLQAGHHAPLGPAETQGRIEAYALRELRRLVEGGKIRLEPEERNSLVPELQARAGEVKSLNVGLEAFQLLAALGAHGAIESALAQRSPEEREMIAKVLNPNT